MTEEKKKKRQTLGLSLSETSTPSLSQEQVRQSLSHGRSKVVTVEVKRKRGEAGASQKISEVASSSHLTNKEQNLRMKALQEALLEEKKRQDREDQEEKEHKAEEALQEAKQEVKQEVEVALEKEETFTQQRQGLRNEPKPSLDQAKDSSGFPRKERARFTGPSSHSPEKQGEKMGQDSEFAGKEKTLGTGSDQVLRPARDSQGFQVAEVRKTSPATKGKENAFLAEGFSETSDFVEAAMRRRHAREEESRSSLAKGLKDSSRKGATQAKGLGKKRERFDRLSTSDDGEDHYRPILGLKKLRTHQKDRRGPVGAAKSSVQRTVVVKEQTVADFADQLGEKVPVVLKLLQKMGLSGLHMGSILDQDTVHLVAEERGCAVKVLDRTDKEAFWMDQEEQNAVHRPPVVTVMGHVDHGKTSLLDALRKTDVVAKEAGGITQHIGAYQVRLPSGKSITFIDTPGHKAFTEMRARGARVTDIVVLVVAADDGVNEQTIEAIRHCQAAQVPLILAINKIDKPAARPDHVRNQLLTYELVVEKLGGNIQDVEVSALKNLNLDGLEEAILLQAEMLDLKADPKLRAMGTVLETRMKKGQGPAATLLVQQGSLKKGDIFVVGDTWGRVRLLFDDKGAMVKEGLPAQPIEVIGFDELPQSGDSFVVVPSESDAKEIVEWKKSKKNDKEVAEVDVSTMSLLERLKTQDLKEQPLIIKTDTQGSLEAIEHELSKIHHEEITIKVIHKAVGPVNEGDVLLAQASGALLIAFSTSLLPEARKLIEQKSVRVLSHRIIYQVADEVREILSGMLAPVFEEEWLGKAEILKVFHVKKSASIAGCLIKEGLFRRNERARVFRGGKIIYEGYIKSLRHLKDDVREKAAGHECGVMLDHFDAFEMGDHLECFTKKRIERSV